MKWEDTATIENDFLQKTLESLEKAAEKAERWNDSIIDMIRLYFVDMQTIYQVLYTKMKKEDAFILMYLIRHIIIY